MKKIKEEDLSVRLIIKHEDGAGKEFLDDLVEIILLKIMKAGYQKREK